MLRQNLSSAVQDFHRARRRADLERILARLTGQSAELLSYEDVRKKLKVRPDSGWELENIPLDAIVGSVGRYKDFTRSFLPKRDSDQKRWASVEVAMTDPSGVPPIEVYQIGEAYFVKDGNHRVSVARQFGATQIQAYVTKVRTKVPLTPDVQPDDLILKAEYANFLDHTHIDDLRPNADLSVTVPGQYRVLEEHIQVHRYFMGLDQEREISYEEAVAHWYDEVYTPVVQSIRKRGILYDFPERTETDLYLWIAEHRAGLEEELGWDIGPEAAAEDLVSQFSPRPQRVIARMGEKILDAITPDELEVGPPPGQWREERLSNRREDRLFADLLVAINGESTGWRALDQALIIAQREDARVHGLHVVASEARKESVAEIVQAEFDRRCEAAGIAGHLSFDVGPVKRQLCDRARWTDLVVLSLDHPPEPRAIAKLGSGLTTIIQRCPRPVLTVPMALSRINHLLLAYDGSPKADEALFVATYLAGRWSADLVVAVALENGETTNQTTMHAREYLEAHGVDAAFVEEDGSADETIMRTAEKYDCDLVVVGGYGSSPVVEMVLGSTLDNLLRECQHPLLICR